MSKPWDVEDTPLSDQRAKLFADYATGRRVTHDLARLERRLRHAERLLRAVGCAEFGGTYCDDVGGHNWFDLRNDYLAAAREEDGK